MVWLQHETISNYVLVTQDDLMNIFFLLSQNAAISQWIDPGLVTRIDSYTREGVTRVSEMRRLLKIALKKNL